MMITLQSILFLYALAATLTVAVVPTVLDGKPTLLSTKLIIGVTWPFWLVLFLIRTGTRAAHWLFFGSGE